MREVFEHQQRAYSIPGPQDMVAHMARRTAKEAASASGCTFCKLVLDHDAPAFVLP